MNNPWWSVTTILFIQIIFLCPLNHNGTTYRCHCSKVYESNTTLELMDMCTKETLFFRSRPLNFVTYGLLNARCNENCIITNCIFIIIPHKSIVYDYVINCRVSYTWWIEIIVALGVHHLITISPLLMDLIWA